MTRQEHLAWCKERALAYIERGEIQEGLTSMMSDMDKHPDTVNLALYQLTVGLMAIGDLSTIEQARRHIEGFN
jgi:hypothetical protein